MGSSPVLNSTQQKKLEKIAKQTGYSLEELLFDAVNWYLETKAPTLKLTP